MLRVRDRRDGRLLAVGSGADGRRFPPPRHHVPPFGRPDLEGRLPELLQGI